MSRRLAMFPLSTVVFPGERLPLHVFEPRYRRLVADCTAPGRRGGEAFGIVLIRRGSEVGGGDERERVATAVALEEVGEFPDGRFVLIVRGLARVEVLDWLEDDPYPVAVVDDLGPAGAGPWPDADDDLAEATAAVARVRTLLAELSEDGGGSRHSAPRGDEDATARAKAWALAAALPVSAYDRQRLLVVAGDQERCRMITSLAGELGDDLVRMMGGEPG